MVAVADDDEPDLERAPRGAPADAGRALLLDDPRERGVSPERFAELRTDVPIIAISAFTSPEEQQKAVDAGFALDKRDPRSVGRNCRIGFIEWTRDDRHESRDHDGEGSALLEEHVGLVQVLLLEHVAAEQLQRLRHADRLVRGKPGHARSAPRCDEADGAVVVGDGAVRLAPSVGLVDPRPIGESVQQRLERLVDAHREIEREIDYTENLEEAVDQWQLGQWKDVYINWRTFDAFSVKGGRFKMPFGLEQTTSVSDLDFAYRAAGSVKIAPGRDRGVMAYGDLFDGALAYEAGVFDDDGDNGTLEEFRFVDAGQTIDDLEDVGPSVAVRVVAEIFRGLPVPERLKGAEVGAAYTSSQVPEGLNSLQGEEVWGYNFFDRVYVNGRRQRLGFQFDWSPGPTGFPSGSRCVPPTRFTPPTPGIASMRVAMTSSARSVSS